MKIYIDFDGVILNTIEVSYKRIREQFGENASIEDSTSFYRSINWDEFLRECTPINHSIDCLKQIMNSKKYDVAILTHVLSLEEEKAKQKYLKEYLPKIKYIPVTVPKPKWAAVNCKNSILVDDYSQNLREWQEHGGIAIKFSQKDKEYDFLTIKGLDELLKENTNIFNQINNKKR